MKKPWFHWSDLVFIGITGISTGLAVAAQLTPQDTAPVGYCVLWVAVAGFWLVTGLMYWTRYQILRCFRYASNNMIVAWADAEYAVPEASFSAEVERLLRILQPQYPQAQRALGGCIVFFLSPTFQAGTGALARRVAGLQDDMVVCVGWHKNLPDSALAHELTHRVFQVLAGDPDETQGHRLMEKLGI